MYDGMPHKLLIARVYPRLLEADFSSAWSFTCIVVWEEHDNA